jgi:hypothetical protein
LRILLTAKMAIVIRGAKMKKGIWKIWLVLVVVSLSGGIASATVITLDFEDLTLGQSYNVGDSFTTSGVVITVEEFQGPEGSWYTYGDVTVETDIGPGFINTAGGSGNELGVRSVNLYFDFDTTLSGLELLYGDFGGNLNIELNGDFVNFNNFIDIDNTTIGGTTISALDTGTPGHSTGTLSVVGTIQSFKIGGAELWVDNVVALPEPGTVLLLGFGGLALLRRRKG